MHDSELWRRGCCLKRIKRGDQRHRNWQQLNDGYERFYIDDKHDFHNKHHIDDQHGWQQWNDFIGNRWRGRFDDDDDRHGRKQWHNYDDRYRW